MSDPGATRPHTTRARSGIAVVVAALSSVLVAALLAATTAAAAPFALRVNAGGGSYADPSGNAWAADAGANGGWKFGTTAGISGTSNPTAYTTEHYGMTGYRVAVPSATTYHVVLDFDEIYWTSAGRRVFDVTAEGKLVASRLDIFATVGKNRAYQVAFDTAITDGALDLGFKVYADYAKIAGIEITAAATTATTTTTLPPPTTTSTSTTTTTRPTTTTSPPTTTTRPTTTTAPPTTTLPGSPSTLFAASSPFNLPVTASPALAANSASIVSYLVSNGQSINADMYEFGVPIFDADASTPRTSVTCTEPWGTCPFSGKSVPIPAAAAPTSGSDGVLTVVDWPTRNSYELWQAVQSGSTWKTSWGAIHSIDGDGRDTPGGGNAVGGGVSRLAGTVRVAEIRNGAIPHALVFATSNACNNGFQYPATKSDGASGRSDCIQEGARIQLDPSVNVDAISGITPGEKAIGHALQTYGAYAVDNAGSNIAFAFEKPTSEDGADPYPGAGLAWDYYNMPHIPWSRLRVLHAWNGQ